MIDESKPEGTRRNVLNKLISIGVQQADSAAANTMVRTADSSKHRIPGSPGPGAMAPKPFPPVRRQRMQIPKRWALAQLGI